MVLAASDFGEDVIQENGGVVLDVLMIKEQLGEEGEVFAVDWVLETVHFEHRYLRFWISVDFVTGWVP